MGKWKTIVKSLIVIIVVLVILYLYTKHLVYKTTYIDYIEDSVKGTSIDPYLVLSMIKVESGFNVNAVSSKEAKGLMQIKDSTYEDVKDSFTNRNDSIDIFDPKTNIKVGVSYFQKLIRRYNGNYYIALLAYNGGMGNVDAWLKKGIITSDLDTENVPEVPFNETKNYLKKVISIYNIYKFLYNL